MHRKFAYVLPRVGSATLPLLALLSVTALLPAAPAQAQEAAPVVAAAPVDPDAPKVDGRAAWDDRFLYFAFQVDDDDVQGTNNRAMGDAAKDDSIAVYLHLDAMGAAPAAPTERTQAMIVSVANGFTYLSGKTGALAPDPTFAIKFGTTIQGTINRSDDRDRGYTVTLALPWQKLGIDPKDIKDGMEIPFVAVARSRGNTLTTTNAGVATEEDVSVPVKYGRLRFLLKPDNAADVKKTPGTLAAVRLAEKATLPIDGVFRIEQWPEVSRFVFVSPAPRKPETAIVTAPLPEEADDAIAPTVSLDATKPIPGLEKHVMARYVLGFQADLHKVASPNRGIYAPDGTLLLADQPAVGIGPWFSTDRVAWHKGQLAEMPRYGVDTALVQFGGPASPVGALDEKALLVLLTAARELTAENQQRPLLAPCVDTALLTASATKPDLSTPEGRETLWRSVRRWFTLVSPDLRLRVTLPPNAEGKTIAVYPVFLSDGSALAGLDAAWDDDMRTRFAQEFGAASGGATLLFIGGDNFAAGKVVATAPLAAEGVGTGAIRIGVARPGSDALGGALVPRRNGDTYRASWEAAVNAGADWIVVNSWNDWLTGTEVSASRQYGLKYLDQTRILGVTTSGLPEKSVQFSDQDAPRSLRPGQVVTVNVAFKNTGRTPLRGTDGVSLAYRWRRDGKIVAHGPLRLPLAGSLLPTQTARLPIGVLASATRPAAAPVPSPGELFTPLTPGVYTLEVGLIEQAGSSLAAPDTPPVFYGEEGGKGEGNFLRVGIRLAPSLPDRVEFAESVTPPLIVSGASVGTRLRMRWLGDKPITPDEAQLVYQVLSEDGQRVVQSGTAPLLRPLPPGQWVTEPAVIQLGQNGVPTPGFPELRRSATDQSGGYRLRWLLGRIQSTDSIPGEYQEHIALYPTADDARVAPVNTIPQTVNAAAQTTMEVTVTNRGATAWAAGSHRVGYHWFHPDGVDLQWRPPVTAVIAKELPPGKSVKVSVPVRMPDRDGAYILAFDVLAGTENYLSTGLISRTGDIGLIPVRVTGGRLHFVDLARYFNADAVAGDDKPDDGDLGGTGFALPAEFFPPDTFGIAAYFRSPDDKNDKSGPSYPSGYFSEVTPSARQISFHYGSNRNGMKNALTCDGQTIEVGSDRYVGLHLAVVATGADNTPLKVTLRYKDKTEKTTTLSVAPYLTAPTATEAVAVRVSRKRGKDGDVAATGAVRHVIVPVDVTRELVSITLPTEKQITVFAMTLER